MTAHKKPGRKKRSRQRSILVIVLFMTFVQSSSQFLYFFMPEGFHPAGKTSPTLPRFETNVERMTRDRPVAPRSCEKPTRWPAEPTFHCAGNPTGHTLPG